jgi:PKD repeat protein
MIKRILVGLGVLLSSVSVFAQTSTPSCGTDQHHHEQMAQNPEAKATEAQFKAAWESFKKTESYKQIMNKKGLTKASAPKYIIPVVVHVFSSSKTATENISDAQVQSEIAFLNKSFRNLNSDTANRRVGTLNGELFDFKQTAGDAEIEFRLARKDPQGNCTNGIVRVQTDLADKGNDNLKKTSVWDTKSYFNMWVVRTIDKGPGLSVAGYAQFPFFAGQWSALTDGVMVISNEFGNIGTSQPGQTPNVTTTTHEAGHWLGLFHPFQASDSCEAQNDGVDDTPPTYFQPSTTEPLRNRCNIPLFNSCGNDRFDTLLWDRPDMYENFMDYFIGSCASNMFTKQQIARMHFCLETYRPKLVSYNNLVATGVLDPVTACAPVPSFGVTINGNPAFERLACVSTPLTFTDLSYNGTATSWEWIFGEGANPQTSNLQNPIGVVYTTPGMKTITLKVTNATGSNTKDFTNFIQINTATATSGYMPTPDYPISSEGWELRGDAAASWEVTDLGKYQGYKSLLMRGKGSSSDMYGKEYSVVTPAYDFSNSTTPFFSFWYSYAQNVTATSPSITTSNDELSVQYTINCGLTWNNLKAKVTGASLATISSALAPTVNFVPVSASQWKQVLIPSSSILSISNKSNVRFRILYGYQGGNNFYIDEIELGRSTGLSTLTANQINLNVYPNPFNTTTNISYVLPSAAQTSVEVYDVLGKKVAELFNGKQTEGEQHITFDRTIYGLTNGMYFVKIKIEAGTITQKVLVN